MEKIINSEILLQEFGKELEWVMTYQMNLIEHFFTLTKDPSLIYENATLIATTISEIKTINTSIESIYGFIEFYGEQIKEYKSLYPELDEEFKKLGIQEENQPAERILNKKQIQQLILELQLCLDEEKDPNAIEVIKELIERLKVSDRIQVQQQEYGKEQDGNNG